MTFYRDPETGERISVDEPSGRLGRGGLSMINWIVLIALLIVGATMVYHYADLWSNERVAQSTIDHPPVTSVDPNTDAVRPTAPSNE